MSYLIVYLLVTYSRVRYPITISYLLYLELILPQVEREMREIYSWILSWLHTWASAEGKRGRAPWVFIHDTDKVERWLINSAIFRSCFFPWLLLEIFLPSTLTTYKEFLLKKSLKVIIEIIHYLLSKLNMSVSNEFDRNEPYRSTGNNNRKILRFSLLFSWYALRQGYVTFRLHPSFL